VIRISKLKTCLNWFRTSPLHILLVVCTSVGEYCQIGSPRMTRCGQCSCSSTALSTATWSAWWKFIVVGMLPVKWWGNLQSTGVLMPRVTCTIDRFVREEMRMKTSQININFFNEFMGRCHCRNADSFTCVDWTADGMHLVALLFNRYLRAIH